MRLRPVTLIVTFALGLLVARQPAEAQQPKKVPRIAILSINRPGPRATIDALRQGLRDLGYIEGQNIIIEYRFAERKYDRLPRLATELVSLNPDVIITSTTPGVRAAKKGNNVHPDRCRVCRQSCETGICQKPCATGRKHHRDDIPFSARDYE